MTHKGYTGVLEVDEDANELFGTVVGLQRSVVTFHGKTVEEARRSFEESVDAYLAGCAQEGFEPERPAARPAQVGG